MTSIIPAEMNESIPCASDKYPHFKIENPEPEIAVVKREEDVIEKDCVQNSVEESPDRSTTDGSPHDFDVEHHQKSNMKIQQPEVNDNSQQASGSSTPQASEEGPEKKSESGEDSTQAATHPPNQASHASHHSHYAQYYHSYPHGHASYYYPHGSYYPPPPPPHGHSSYPHSSHHYYAHYPPPPGYYPHPHYHYYSHPPTTSTSSPSDQSSSSTPSAPSPSNSVSTGKGSTNCSKASTPTSVVSKSPPTIKGPYSAFSSTTSTKINKTIKPVAQVPVPLSKPTSKVLKPTPKMVVVTNTNKRKVPETETIFRVNNTKRTKHITVQSKAAAAVIAAKREKTKQQAQEELSKTVLDRRSRKNAQSRLRAAKLKQRIAEIQAKESHLRTEEEITTLAVFEERRQRKNGRSRQRAMERKKEYERIMKIPEEQWSKDEKNFVQETMIAKYKKNEGDRLRRKKLKEELDSTGSISSGWESSTCKGTVSSLKKKSKQAKKKSRASDEIPNFIESSTSDDSEKIDDVSFEHDAFLHKDVPLTPMSQKEAFSLLESTPTNFFGSTIDPNKHPADCFSPNFIFPSPNGKSKDLSAHMDAIDFDSLELHTDGTSILDPSMAMTIDDEVIYSPNLQPPTLHENERSNRSQHPIPQLTSNMRLSPMNLPRRSNTQVSDDGDNFNSDSDPHSFTAVKSENDSGCFDGVASKAIAVSFSVDTA